MVPRIHFERLELEFQTLPKRILAENNPTEINRYNSSYIPKQSLGMGRPRLGFSNGPCATNVRTPFTWTSVVRTKLMAPIKFSKKNQIWIPFISVFFFFQALTIVWCLKNPSATTSSALFAVLQHPKTADASEEMCQNFGQTFEQLLICHDTKAFDQEFKYWKKSFEKARVKSLVTKKNNVNRLVSVPGKRKREKSYQRHHLKTFFCLFKSTWKYFLINSSPCC